MARTIEERRAADCEKARQFRLTHPTYRSEWEAANRERRNAYRKAWRARRREAARLAKIEARREKFGKADAAYRVIEATSKFKRLSSVTK